MASNHLPAVVAAAVSAVLVLGIGVAAGGGEDTETSTGPESTTTSTTTESSTTTKQPSTTTTTPPASSTTNTTAGETTTTQPTTTSTTGRPGTTTTTRGSTPTTAEVTTTTPPPAKPPLFVVTSGSTTAPMEGCGEGRTEAVIKNSGGTSGTFVLSADNPAWIVLPPRSFTLAPGGQVSIVIASAPERQGPVTVRVDVGNETTGNPVDASFTVPITKLEGYDDNCDSV